MTINVTIITKKTVPVTVNGDDIGNSVLLAVAAASRVVDGDLVSVSTDIVEDTETTDETVSE